MVFKSVYSFSRHDIFSESFCRFALVLLLATMLVGLPLQVKGQPKELPMELSAEQILRFADYLFSRNEYFRALGEYQRFLLLYPDDPQAQTASLRIVQCYSRGKRWQEALDAANSFLRDYNQSPLRLQACFMKARALVQLNRGDEARDEYHAIIKMQPGQPLVAEAWYNIGLSYAREHRWLEADEALRQVGSESLIHGEAEAVRQILAEASETKYKDPVMAGVLAIVPGAGHLYCGRPRDAALAFVFTGAFAWATVEAFNQDHDELGIALGLVTLALYAGNIFSAVNVAHKFNDREHRRMEELLAPYERLGSGGRQIPSASLALKFFF